jgi:hypothetical protein
MSLGNNYATLELLMQRPSALGKVFFVDSNGDSGNEGTDPAHPLDSITDALGKCTNSKGDVIVVMGLSPSTSEATETWPININKSGVLLTGLYSRGLLSDSGFGTDETDTATINVGANFVTIEDLYLGIKTGSTTSDVIVGTTSAYAFTLRNCLIETQYTARYGFSTGTTFDFPYLLIEDNTFGSQGSSRFTSAIYIFNATYGRIRRNVFHYCSSYAIHLLASAGNLDILDNVFGLSGDTDGFAVYAANGSTGCIISGNVAAEGLNSPTNDPFWQVSNDDGNHYGINYKGSTATDGVGA